MKSFHITIDSSALRLDKPNDLIIYLKDKLPSQLTKVGLKSITMHCENNLLRLFQKGDVEIKNVYVHCDSVFKDNNLFNGERSDIIGVLVLLSGKTLYD